MDEFSALVFACIGSLLLVGIGFCIAMAFVSYTLAKEKFIKSEFDRAIRKIVKKSKKKQMESKEKS